MRVYNKDLKAGIDTNKTFYVPKPIEKAKIRLFCFHYAGVPAEVYHNFPDIFPDTIEICCIQLPGRGSRLNEPLVKELSILVEKITREILKHQDKPFAFFGHCLGALLGYEIVKYLYQKNLTLPVWLFASGRRAPQLPVLHPNLHILTDNEFLAVMKEINLRPNEFYASPDVIKEHLPIIKADFALVENWQPDYENLKIPVPIWAFGGNSDDFVSEEHIIKWKDCTSNEFNHTMCEGGHFFIHNEIVLTDVIKVISTVLLKHISITTTELQTF